MSEIVSMSSGPQGTASPSEAFSEESSPSSAPEFDHGSGGGEQEAGNGSVPHGTSGEQNGDGQQRTGKRNSRFERARRAREKHEAEFAQRQNALRQKEEALARKEAEIEQAKKPKRDYSLADLKKYREVWKEEADQGIDGRAALVRKADAEIAEMEAEEKASKVTLDLPRRGTPEHQQMWQAAEADLSKLDPEFMKNGSRLDTRLREILSGPNANAYIDHPQGIYAAYDRAKREILEEDVKSLSTENAQLKKELQRYTGLTSIGGGVPGRMGDGGVSSIAEFARLSSADMRKHLLAGAKASKDSSGWL